MSNTLRRPDLCGVIRQHGRIVGGLELPEPHDLFIAQFDREYARIGLTVTPADRVFAETPAASRTRGTPDASVSSVR